MSIGGAISVLAACLWAAGPPAGAGLARQVAEYVRLVRAGAKGDAEVAARLLAAAKTQKDNAPLRAALLAAAYEHGVRTPAGHVSAIAAARALVGERPAEKDTWRRKLVDAYRLRLTHSDREGKDAARMDLFRALVGVADGTAAEGDAGRAVPFYHQARALLYGRRSPLTTELRWKLRDAAAMQAAQGKARVLAARLAKDPSDTAAREQLIRLNVLELNRPDAAARLLTAGVDEACRLYVPLAAKAVDSLGETACLELARWYESLLAPASTSAAARARGLKRTIACYKRYLSLHTAKDLAGLKARSALAAARTSLRELAGLVEYNQFLAFPDSGSALAHAGTKVLNAAFSRRTVEMWVRLGGGDGSLYEEGGHGSGLAVGVYEGRLKLGVRSYKGSRATVECDRPSRGRWVHVAAVFRSGQFALWVDGQFMGRGKVQKTVRGHTQGASFGGHVRDNHCMKWGPAGFVGEIASFRLSSSARYDRPFEPTPTLTRDSETLFLLDAAALKAGAVVDGAIRDQCNAKATWRLIRGARLETPGEGH